MPVKHVRGNAYDLTGSDHSGWLPLLLDQAHACRDDQRLPQWMTVPGSPGARIERHGAPPALPGAGAWKGALM